MEASIGGVASNYEHQNPSKGNNTSLLFVNASVNDRQMKVMIDTGATQTFVSKECFNDMKEKRIVNQVRRRVFLADGVTSLIVYGEIDLFIRIGTTKAFIRAFVVDRLCSGCILGMDFIRKYHLIIDMMKQVMWIGGRSEPLHSSSSVGKVDYRKVVSSISQESMPPRMKPTSIIDRASRGSNVVTPVVTQPLSLPSSTSIPSRETLSLNAVVTCSKTRRKRQRKPKRAPQLIHSSVETNDLPENNHVDSLLKTYHSGPLSGHFAIASTYSKSMNKLWWPSMKNSLVRYVKARLPPDKPARDYIFHESRTEDMLSEHNYRL
jgi:predicted aspartyl protease